MPLNTDRFVNLLLETHRTGIENLLNHLATETDFFKAPASSKYHGSCEGGLLDHSLAVYDCFLKMISTFNVVVPRGSAAIVCLLHDLCKANFYKQEMRWRKDDRNQWEQYSTYGFDDQLPLGHGEKSVIILQQYITLSVDEIMAIRWHMGLSDTDYGLRQSLSAAMDKFPIIIALHAADLAANYFERK